MKQFFNKVKDFFIKNILILALSAILLVIFVFGGIYSRYMTNQIDVHVVERYEQSLVDMVDKGDELVAFDSKGSNQEYPIPSDLDTNYRPDLLESYKVLDDSKKEIGFIYVIETKGNADGLRVAYAISYETSRLAGIQVLSHNETTSVSGQFYNKLNDQFFNQFNNKDLDVVDFSIDDVAGATYSKKAFETGMQYARELYAADTSFEFISVILSIDSLKYNRDLSTITDFAYIAEITFGEADYKSTVYLDSDLNFYSSIDGAVVPDSVKEALPVFVAQAKLIDTSVKVDSYDEGTKELIISVKGFAGRITIKLTINNALDSLESISLDKTSESYPSPTPPQVENDYINEYNNNALVLDSVSGATVTSNAMAKAIEWILAFDAELGGN